MNDIQPISATDETVTLTREDYGRLVNQAGGNTFADPPSRLSDERAFRVLHGRVYEVLHDSRGHPYLKFRGVLIHDEVEAYE